jgi:hypothetical protein
MIDGCFRFRGPFRAWSGQQIHAFGDRQFDIRFAFEPTKLGVTFVYRAEVDVLWTDLEKFLLSDKPISALDGGKRVVMGYCGALPGAAKPDFALEGFPPLPSRIH